MAALLERIAAARAPAEKRYSVDQWISEYLVPSQFQFGGITYPFGLTQTWSGGNRAQEFTSSLPGHLAALRASPPAFAAQMVRALVLAQVRFTFRNPPWHPRTPRRTFGTSELRLLEQPWPKATTAELVARMEWHAGLAGNAYVTRQSRRLRVLRPDWTAVIHGSELEPDDPAGALDQEVVGFAYWNGGPMSGREPQILLPDDVAHWSPLPDPESPSMGMSWITPAIREIQGDRLATDHKIKFFENSATPNLVVKGLQATTKEQFDDIVDMIEERHSGVRNAYRTLYLTAGADAIVVGKDLQQIDFKATQGAGETRISLLSRVHPVILAIAEGMQGSSLNAGNFGMARRIWADTWITPTLQDLAASLAPLLRVPADAELWFDTADMPILREDAKDAAEIEQLKAEMITKYVREGFTAESAIAAVNGGDITLLQHSGLVSVQLQEPGVTVDDAQTNPVRAALEMAVRMLADAENDRRAITAGGS